MKLCFVYSGNTECYSKMELSTFFPRNDRDSLVAQASTIKWLNIRNLGMYQGKNTCCSTSGDYQHFWETTRYLAQPCTETRKWTAYEIEYNLPPKRNLNSARWCNEMVLPKFCAILRNLLFANPKGGGKILVRGNVPPPKEAPDMCHM